MSTLPQNQNRIHSEIVEMFADYEERDIALSHVPPLRKKTNALRTRDLLSSRLSYLTDDQNFIPEPIYAT
jgi:hypothetical protein